MRDPYLDKPQLSRFWGKIKSVLFTPLSERVTDHENTTDAMQTRCRREWTPLNPVWIRLSLNTFTISSAFPTMSPLPLLTALW